MSGRDDSAAGVTFTRFERFWHWTQTLLVAGLLYTGFGMYGLHDLLNFGTAMEWHLVFGWSLIGLWLLAMLWHWFTGQWRQYVPTSRGLLRVVTYYLYGMFSGEAKPYQPTPLAKHNPLQRIAYLVFKLLIAPALWLSGLLLLFYPAWRASALGPGLEHAVVAWIHVAAAYALILFLVAHIYIAATTGKPWYAYLRAMVTGREPGS
jgi:thiosulfate reductase cytochrome b subunit